MDAEGKPPTADTQVAGSIPARCFMTHPDITHMERTGETPGAEEEPEQEEPCDDYADWRERRADCIDDDPEYWGK